MSITFIVANKFAAGNTEIAGEKYFADCTVSISHDFSNSVTEHPVETGVSFSDHVQLKNNRFVVSGIFGQYGLNDFRSDTLTRTVDRIPQAYAFLRRLRDNRLTFTLVSKYETYYDCVVEGLSIPASVESSNSLYFDLNIVQIRKATTETVKLISATRVVNGKKDTASSTTNGGKQPTTGRSVLKAIGVETSVDGLIKDIFKNGGE